MIDFGIYRRGMKLMQRINESMATQSFVLTSVWQAIIATSLEIRVYLRNKNAGKMVEQLFPGTCNSEPSTSIVRMKNITEENILFISFQIFQVWFCFNAIYNQNTIQIITISAINFCCACLSIVQLLEVIKWYRDFEHECPDGIDQMKLEQKYPTNDVPLIITLMVFATIISFLSWNLYRQFGWNIYKKIGCDISMQAIYRTYLIYVMLLKLGLFFILGLAIESCLVFGINLSSEDINHIRYIPKIIYLFHLVVTCLIILNQILGYRSVRKEIKLGMILVGSFWVVIILDFCILLFYSIGNVKDSWYFYIVYLFVGIALSLLSLVWSVRVKTNFNKGLQDHIDQEIRKPNSGNNPFPQVPQEAIKKPDRWSIDD
ncbi:5507_t:CDS:2 [Funneliformis geosporum]|uniref:17126_t:CDS:1 n=1 Tax=Funneliformis geosporum TaxID=1117311 RepID=A0A9W4WMF7_9GLOM|nr:17126_t:CDS:2 [Funneliformis geosporum]CAI2180026.1 5507_t:CDS:2 [Funneliformis geosporum]